MSTTQVDPKKRNSRVERRGRFTITELDAPASPVFSESMDTENTYVDLNQNQNPTQNQTNPHALPPLPQSHVDDRSKSLEVSELKGDGNGISVSLSLSASGVSTNTEANDPTYAAETETDNDSENPLFSRSAPVLEDHGLVPSLSDNTMNMSAVSAASSSVVSEKTRASVLPRPQQLPLDRRVQRKGRFTIIELSSAASPTHLSSDEDDLLFSDATAHGQEVENGALSESSFSHDGSVSRSPPVEGETAVAVAAGTGTGDSTGRRPRERSTSGHLASMMRMRSVSPMRGMPDPHGEPIEASSYGSLPFRHNSTPSGTWSEQYGTSPKTPPLLDGSLSSVLPVDKRGSQSSYIEHRPMIPHQKAITISAEQFLQQQQTIASLIRQQQELKQLIGVLQEQQQHLMNFPMQLSELKREQAQSDAHNEAMRDVRMQVDVLTRANDSLQSLLAQAENEGQDRAMEMECLSSENDELRNRCALLERKFQEERKVSFAFEQEVKQLRMQLQYTRQTSPLLKDAPSIATRPTSAHRDDYRTIVESTSAR